MDSDQTDGGNLSHDKKKGERIGEKHVAPSEWDVRKIDLPIVQTNLSAPSPTDNSTVILIGPHQWPTVSIESQPDDSAYTDEWNRKGHPDNLSPEAVGSKQTVGELKSLFEERFILNTREKNEGKFVARHCHTPGQRIDCKPHDVPSKSFTTFKPTVGSNRTTGDSVSSGWESGHTNRSTSFKLPTSERTYLVDSRISGQCSYCAWQNRGKYYKIRHS